MNNLQFSLNLLPYILPIVNEHQQSGQQLDNLCGPYWVAIFLRSRDFLITSEQIAQQAGSVLPIGEPLTWLPSGAVTYQEYAVPLPTTTCLSDAGTSAQGLMDAVTYLSHSAYQLLPIQTEWSSDRLLLLLELCHTHPEWQAIPLCNIKTGHLWGTSLSLSKAIAYLDGQPIDPPPADWNVGHFLILTGTVTGAVNSLIWVGDTYPQLGWQGYHLQPPDAIAHALNRGDGLGGGILLFIATQDQSQVTQAMQEKGFQVAVWDNGSPKKS